MSLTHWIIEITCTSITTQGIWYGYHKIVKLRSKDEIVPPSVNILNYGHGDVILPSASDPRWKPNEPGGFEFNKLIEVKKKNDSICNIEIINKSRTMSVEHKINYYYEIWNSVAQREIDKALFMSDEEAKLLNEPSNNNNQQPV